MGTTYGTLPGMDDPLDFAGTGLDRAVHKRGQQGWLEQQCRISETCYVLLWRNRTLVETLSSTSFRVLPTHDSQTQDILQKSGETVFLGLEQKPENTSLPWLAVDVSHLNEDQALKLVNHTDARFMDLRDVASHCHSVNKPETIARAAYARAMVHWHRRHRFCGSCGHQTESSQGGHVRQCTNPDCGKTHFPRTDPAVIMLVESRDPASGEALCLLGRSPNWPDGQFSTLAGFVEPGESLIEAVRREVFEEVGVIVDDVRYSGSQPWPFPGSLMLGFIATAKYQKITRDEKEIADARWFSRDQIRHFSQWGDETPGVLKLPRPVSISRTLIDDWLDG